MIMIITVHVHFTTLANQLEMHATESTLILNIILRGLLRVYFYTRVVKMMKSTLVAHTSKGKKRVVPWVCVFVFSRYLVHSMWHDQTQKIKQTVNWERKRIVLKCCKIISSDPYHRIRNRSKIEKEREKNVRTQFNRKKNNERQINKPSAQCFHLTNRKQWYMYTNKISCRCFENSSNRFDYWNKFLFLYVSRGLKMRNIVNADIIIVQSLFNTWNKLLIYIVRYHCGRIQFLTKHVLEKYKESNCKIGIPSRQIVTAPGTLNPIEIENNVCHCQVQLFTSTKTKRKTNKNERNPKCRCECKQT